jgi:hypothetical protein
VTRDDLAFCWRCSFACLDTAVFVAAPLLVAQLLIERNRRRLYRRRAGSLAFVFAAYTGYNLWRTGHAVPISGAIRSSFPAITWHGTYLIEPINIAEMYGWRTLVSANMLVVSSVLLLGFALLTLARPARFGYKRCRLASSAPRCRQFLLFHNGKTIDPRYFALPLTASVFLLTAVLALARTYEAVDKWPASFCFAVVGLLVESIVYGTGSRTITTRRAIRRTSFAMPAKP